MLITLRLSSELWNGQLFGLMLPIWMTEVMPAYGEPEQILRTLCKTLNLVPGALNLMTN